MSSNNWSSRELNDHSKPLSYKSTNSNVDNEALLRRHSKIEVHPNPTVFTRHAQELERITKDSRNQTPYPVPNVTPKQTILGQIPTILKKQLKLKPAEEYARRFLPLYPMLKTYTIAKFRNDVVAGVTVAVMVIPLSLSYARLAGLPVIYGLYSSFIPPIVYPIFGSTHHLSVGPAALLSLLVSKGVGDVLAKMAENHPELPELADPEDETYIQIYTGLAVQCAFMAAILNLAMGIFQLGFVTQFLSRAVVSGFISGAAITIIFSQLQHILGLRHPPANKLHEIIKNLIGKIDDFQWEPFLLGCACIVFLVSAKNISLNQKIQARFKHIKWLRAISPFAVSIFGIVLAKLLGTSNNTPFRVAGTIPNGLPPVTIGDWFPINNDLWVVVTSIVVVGFVQSISLSKRLGYRRGYEVDSSQELLALGMANLVGGIFGAYPTGGAIGQTAVNDEIGAETGLASVFTGLVVMFVLLFLTPVFELMPLTVLAAIVISFVDYPEAIYLFKVHKFDFAVWIFAFLGTLFLGVEYGLAIAVGISLLLVIWESAYPKIAELGRLPGTTLYRNIAQYDGELVVVVIFVYPNIDGIAQDAERYDGIVIVRIDAPIYFANAANVRDEIRKYKRYALEESQTQGTSVQFILLDFSPVSRIDTTGLHMLDDMYTTQKNLNTQLCICNPGIEVADRMNKSGLADKIGREHIFTSVIDAVVWCLNVMDSRAEVARKVEEGEEEGESSKVEGSVENL